MSNIKNRKEGGFTIIEVLIVLAIAGLIMLIVFLAVPALQRNARNTQRKNDAANYLSAVNEFMNNNNGKTAVTADLTTVNSLAKLSTLTAPSAVTTGAQTGTIAVDDMQLVTGAKCSTSTVGDTAAGSTRQFALRYGIENSAGSVVKQCIDS